MQQSIIEKGLKYLMKKYRLRKSELAYIGVMDCSYQAPNALLLHYNILKKGHNLFKSTVTMKHNF